MSQLTLREREPVLLVPRADPGKAIWLLVEQRDYKTYFVIYPGRACTRQPRVGFTVHDRTLGRLVSLALLAKTLEIAGTLPLVQDRVTYGAIVEVDLSLGSVLLNVPDTIIVRGERR